MLKNFQLDGLRKFVRNKKNCPIIFVKKSEDLFLLLPIFRDKKDTIFTKKKFSKFFRKPFLDRSFLLVGIPCNILCNTLWVKLFKTHNCFVWDIETRSVDKSHIIKFNNLNANPSVSCSKISCRTVLIPEFKISYAAKVSHDKILFFGQN